MTFDITTGLIVLFVLVFLAAAAVYNNIKNNNRLRNHIKSSWGKVPDIKYKPGDMESIAKFYNNLSKKEKDRFYIDNITWNDLDMDKIFTRINNTCSSPGEEFLYYLLRTPNFTANELNEKEKLMDFFDKNVTIREKIQFLLSKIGKSRNLIPLQ
ncbi:MAG TPA: hypothetical protein PK566_04230 [Pseudobacteroides sp.]|nr:hypothetical protein [Pseudobacteroides sp.]